MSPKYDYAAKRKDPRWQKKRLDILNRDNFACVSCGSTTSPLHVHHRYYVSKREPWNYPDFCLLSLCEGCHDFLHRDVDDVQYPDQWEILANEVLRFEELDAITLAFHLCKARVAGVSIQQITAAIQATHA